MSLQDTLFALESHESPDIVVVGLQEMVDLNPQNVIIMSNDTSIVVWDQLILQNLSRYGSFVKVTHADLVGIYTTIYVRKQHVHRIRCIELDIVKTGLGGALGNKGATGIRFKIDDTSLVFINCHLSSGAKQAESRLLEVRDIHDRLFLKMRQHQPDYRFFFGDMNFRLDSSYAQIIAHIKCYRNHMRLDQVYISMIT